MITRAEIIALDPVLVAARDDGAIAAALSAGRTKRVFTGVGNGSILQAIGIAAGNALLDVLNTREEFRYVKPLLDQGRLDVSSDLVRSTLDTFVQSGVITTAQGEAIKALGEIPDPVTSQEVTQALEGWP